MKKFGYFTSQDPRLEGLLYGNWGSRPYEYMWASTVESCEGKHVLDCGTGLPNEHNWNEYVKQVLKPASYTGVDFDSRMKDREVITENHKMLWMDLTDLKFPDNSFDFCYSISTFEHFNTVEIFVKAMNEIHRVLKPGAKMVLTLDEWWDVNYTNFDWVPWNNLEIDLINCGAMERGQVSFDMQDFATIIAEKFAPVDKFNIADFPNKYNADERLLHNKYWNSCVSFGVFEKI